MIEGPPGLRPERLTRLIRRSVDTMALDLGGAVVLTEAATGPYAVTPVLAALAGAARVDAVTRSTRHGTVEQVTVETMRLADALGVADAIRIIDRGDGPVDADVIRSADVVTNSGHLRPLDAGFVSAMQSTAVVPLMFEAWEIDLGRMDVDLDELRRREIVFAGTNERHPAVDVFSFLPSMAVKLLSDAAVATYASKLLVVCDNPFAPYLQRGLRAAGATVVDRVRFDASDLADDLDAVVIALTPTGAPVLDEADIAAIASAAPAAVLAQYWGDISRERCRAHHVPCVPEDDPGAGHMGVLPSAVGPEPIVRLQAGGLKVAEVLMKPETRWSDEERAYVDRL